MQLVQRPVGVRVKMDGWEKYQVHVIAELKRLNGCLDKMDTKLDSLSTELTTLKVKSGFWGAISGAITGIISVFFIFITFIRGGGN